MPLSRSEPVTESAAQTLSTEDIVRSYPEEWLQHRQALETIMLAGAQSRATKWDADLHLKNVWIWGVPRVGKSQWAVEQSPMTTTLKKTRDHWWDGGSCRKLCKRRKRRASEREQSFNESITLATLLAISV
jgi:hypothetical protein